MSAAENQAVFLSYASQDAAAVRRICDALRAAGGVEVWFDQNELTGGDAWDAKIRGQIASGALFLPVISANATARVAGIFSVGGGRIMEWRTGPRDLKARSGVAPFAEGAAQFSATAADAGRSAVSLTAFSDPARSG